MKNITQKVSLSTFILAVLCFILPFVSFSCAGQKVETFSGIQLVTGTTIRRPEPFGVSVKQKVDPEPLAVLAFLVALAGIGASLVKGKKGAIGSASLAGLGVILLMALRSKLEVEVLNQTSGAIQAHYEAGFYLVTVFLVIAAGTSVFAIFQGKHPPLPAAQQTANSRLCAQCGAENEPSNQFCGGCGAKLG